MSTINNEQIIRTILANIGVYPGDPPARYVYSYTNFEGRKTYAVADSNIRYMPSEYVRNPILLMVGGDLTEHGKKELGALNAKLGFSPIDITQL